MSQSNPKGIERKKIGTNLPDYPKYQGWGSSEKRDSETNVLLEERETTATLGTFCLIDKN